MRAVAPPGDFGPPRATKQIEMGTYRQLHQWKHTVAMDFNAAEWGVPPRTLSVTQTADYGASLKRADMTAPVPRLHCPFHQKDPDTYGRCGSCNGKGFETLTRLM